MQVRSRCFSGKHMIKTIATCASVSFYEEVISIQHELEKMGFKVLVPDLATEMERTNNYDKLAHYEKFDARQPSVKRKLMDDHFRKIEKSDAVLVINNRKHELDGYVGPNVLMEIMVGYYLKKPIYLLNPLPKELSAYDEIMALEPTILNGDLTKLT